NPARCHAQIATAKARAHTIHAHLGGRPVCNPAGARAAAAATTNPEARTRPWRLPVYGMGVCV
ncbi:MAG: hypothetical protein WCP29_11130, partial [Acidobacteriota bacterium]